MDGWLSGKNIQQILIMCSGKTSLTHVSRPVKKLLQNGDADAQLQLGGQGLGKDFISEQSVTRPSLVSASISPAYPASSSASNSNLISGRILGDR